MNEKLRGLVDKAATFGKKLRWVAWPLLGVFSLVPLTLIGSAAWIASNSAEKYRGALEQKIRETPGVKNVNVGPLNWTYGWHDLSFGIRTKGLAIETETTVDRFEFTEVSFLVQPLKVIFGKLPMKLRARGGRLAAELKNNTVAEPEVKEGGEPIPSPPLPSWLEHLGLDGDIEFDEIDFRPPASFVRKGERTAIRLEKTKVKLHLGGIPGPFSIDLESDVDVDLGTPEISARGPTTVELEGYFQVERSRPPAGIRLDKFEVDLGESTITGLGVVEKPSTIPLSFRSKVQILLGETWAARSIDVVEGELEYDSVTMSLGGKYEPGRKGVFRWGIGRSELRELRLPLSGLRELPLEGLVETSGQFVSGANGIEKGNWRIALNNIKFNAPNLRSDETSAKGRMTASLMSEGVVEGGRINSPRTEIQLDGSDAELNFLRGRLRKPVGEPFAFIVKARIEDNKFLMKQLSGTLYTMQFNGEGEIKDVGEYLAGATTSYRLNLFSNKVDIAKYAPHFPLFRRPPPLEGFFEASGAIEGDLHGLIAPFDDMNWRVDSLNLSNFRVVIDRESTVQFGLSISNFGLNGPAEASLMFKGRGKGFVVDRALLVAQADLSKAAILLHDDVWKPVGIPFFFDLSADQTSQTLLVRRGKAVLGDADLDFSGRLLAASPNSYLDVSTVHPFRLARFAASMGSATGTLPLDGQVLWKGRLQMSPRPEIQSGFDWKTLTLLGTLEVSGIKGHGFGLRDPIVDGSLRAAVEPAGVSLSEAHLKTNRSRFFASGRMNFLDENNDPRRRSRNVARLLKGEGWDVNLSLSADRLSDSDFPVFDPPPVNTLSNMKPRREPVERLVKNAVLSETSKTSKASFNVRVGSGEWNDDAFSNLNARLLWDRGRLNVRPFAVDTRGSRVSGTMSWDFSKAVEVDEAPEYAATLKIAGWPWSESPRETPTARLDGDLTLSSAGFAVPELKAAMKGRFLGRVRDLRTPLAAATDRALKPFFAKPEVHDYTMKDLKEAACTAPAAAGDLEASFDGDVVKVDALKLRRADDSGYDFKGAFAKGEFRLNGSFVSGRDCLKGDSRVCLEPALKWSVEGRPSEPKVRLASERESAQTFVKCVADRIAERAEKASR